MQPVIEHQSAVGGRCPNGACLRRPARRPIEKATCAAALLCKGVLHLWRDGRVEVNFPVSKIARFPHSVGGALIARALARLQMALYSEPGGFAMPADLKIGDRVRVAPGYRGPQYRPGDAGTIVAVLPAPAAGGMPRYLVQMDRAPGQLHPTFYADEVERA